MFNTCNVSMHPMHATLTLQSGCLMLDDIVSHALGNLTNAQRMVNRSLPDPEKTWSSNF